MHTFLDGVCSERDRDTDSHSRQHKQTNSMFCTTALLLRVILVGPRRERYLMNIELSGGDGQVGFNMRLLIILLLKNKIINKIK